MRRRRPPRSPGHRGLKRRGGGLLLLLLLRLLPPPRLAADAVHALALARGDDQDDESCLNNIATIFRYALGMERHAFFTSGDARRVAERCLALHDNNGAGAGQGGYGESQGMYLQQEATVQTAASAFYYGDGQLKWILQKLPNLAVPQRCSFLHFFPVFLQKFDTGPELVPVPPPAERGIQTLPLTDHQFAISNHPPEHWEPRGHLVNAAETWQLAEGIALNHLPQARGFDKMVLRGGYERGNDHAPLRRTWLF